MEWDCRSCLSSGAIRRYQVRGKIPFDLDILHMFIVSVYSEKLSYIWYKCGRRVDRYSMEMDEIYIGKDIGR